MRISFIMPAYKAAFLEDAIGSIVSQTCPDWELVVVDDCSPENLKQIVDKFDDPRISYHRNDVNIGGKDLVAQWNHSIGFARGEWIVMAADDDTYDSRFCENVAMLSEKYPDVNLIRSRVEQIDGAGEHIWSERNYEEFVSGYEFLYDWLVGSSITCVGNFAFRASELRRIGGFVNFPCGFCSDLATPFLMASEGVANTAELLFNFRQTDVHLSADKSRLLEKLAATTSFYRWLDKFEYPEPVYRRDMELYKFKNREYVHDKCVYDYFNQVIKFVPLSKLVNYVKACELAGPCEKFMFVLRWLKRKIIKSPDGI